MMSSRTAILIGSVLMLQVIAGCSQTRFDVEREETLIGQCTKICDASGAWVFEDPDGRSVVDIWMEPEGIYARDRKTELVRFYQSIEPDQYQHDDGELLEFENDDLMIRHRVSGAKLTQRRVET